MTQQVQFYPLGGGLDITTAAIAAKPGTARAALNYESDVTGYRRMSGYERYDGQTSPTDAYDAAADVVTGAIDRETARAAIDAVPGEGPVRGVWYFNGDVYAFRDVTPIAQVVTDGTSTTGWVDNSAILGGYTGAGVLTSTGGKLRISMGSGLSASGFGKQFTVVPGTSYTITLDKPIFTDTFAAFTVGATNGGYELVNNSGTWTGVGPFAYTFTPVTSTIWVTIDNNFAGGAGSVDFDNVSLIANDPTAAAMYKATNTGWQLVSSAFQDGGHYEFVNYNFTGAASLVKMFGVNGIDKAFQFDGTTVTFLTTGMAPDAPFKIEAHKRHLFLAFPGGSLQHSALGDPLTWTAVSGAAELALGDEITNLVSAAPTNLVVTAKNSVSLLYGSDASDWQLEALTNEAGALPYTAEKMGPVIYMDNRGIRNLTTTPAFGNFNIGTMTLLIAPLIRSKLAAGQLPVASLRVRGKDLYRVFFEDGYGLSVYMGRKNPEVMPIDLAVGITCVCSAETEDNSEKIWFGADNGFVYQMDRGRSYDGEALQYHLRLPFNHMGGPQVLKRWHKAVIEYDAGGAINLRIAGEVDYGDPNEPPLVEQNIMVAGGGGFWDTANWDQFFWSAPIEGKMEVFIDAVGQSMSLLLGGSQADEEPHIFQGLTLFFTVRGMKR